MTQVSTQLPIIDFAPFREGNTATRYAISKEIYSAFHEIGFMYLKNPGIDSDSIAKTFEYSRKLFDLPLPEKNKVAWSNESSNRGYVGVGRERLDESKPGDLKEAYNISLELDGWLEGNEKFRQTMLNFFSACNETAKAICQALAIALNLPEAFFVNNHNQQDNTLRLLHYPPIERTPEPEQLRAGEHSDYGSFTLLFQDNVKGLEVRNSSGEWIEAPFIPETIVVNTGDLMERWTNRVFRSTKHRVRIPQDIRAKRSRYSIAIFCHPNPDTLWGRQVA